MRDMLAGEHQRRRKATIKRVINAFKACFKRAGAADRILKRLKKFRSADSARLRWLTLEEATRLQNASGPDFRPLVRAALLTGCRAGELLALRAGDFDPYSETVLVADSKSGKPWRVPLTEDGMKSTMGTFGALTGRRCDPRRTSELWCVCGRSGAKREATAVGDSVNFRTVYHVAFRLH
jgi:integrase